MNKNGCFNLNNFAPEQWDCRDCPLAIDLLRWLDELSRTNLQYEKEIARLRAGGH
jgi:hypothetical protein